MSSENIASESKTSTFLPAIPIRPRRLRRTPGLRRMVRENHLTVGSKELSDGSCCDL